MCLCTTVEEKEGAPWFLLHGSPEPQYVFPISLLPSWEPSLILSSGSGVISVAELGELWLEAIAKQGLEKPPANTVPLGEVGIFLAYMIFFYRSNK